MDDIIDRTMEGLGDLTADDVYTEVKDMLRGDESAKILNSKRFTVWLKVHQTDIIEWQRSQGRLG